MRASSLSIFAVALAAAACPSPVAPPAPPAAEPPAPTPASAPATPPPEAPRAEPTPAAVDADPVTCVVDGIEYLAADGSVYGCEGGGNWCAGTPPDPGICGRPAGAATVPPDLIGTWTYAVGTCRGSSFTITATRVEYHAALEPLGGGRIVQVHQRAEGTLIETILAGEGRYLSLRPLDDSGILAYGVGSTEEQSRTERCTVMR